MMSSKPQDTERPGGHYHVDVFAGPKQAFVRGFTLLGVEGGGWTVYDEMGVIGAPRNLAEALPLEEAIRFALETLYDQVDKPIRPVWGGAPFDLLGYPRPTIWSALRAVLTRKVMTADQVGSDGRPLNPAAATAR